MSEGEQVVDPEETITIYFYTTYVTHRSNGDLAHASASIGLNIYKKSLPLHCVPIWHLIKALRDKLGQPFLTITNVEIIDKFQHDEISAYLRQNGKDWTTYDPDRKATVKSTTGLQLVDDPKER
jgi:hypothetical protein